jgi:hypothetical protein
MEIEEMESLLEPWLPKDRRYTVRITDENGTVYFEKKNITGEGVERIIKFIEEDLWE